MLTQWKMANPLTTSEAADLLALDRRTILKYIERGLIQARKHGRDWQIDPDEVERYQRERRKPGRPKKVTEEEILDMAIKNIALGSAVDPHY